MFNNGMQTPQNRPRVTKAVMIESLGYDNQYLRPFQTHYDGYVHQGLMEATNYGQQVDSNTLSPVATNFIQPRSAVSAGDAAFIDNGFNESRFSFLIEFTINEPGTRAQQRHIVSGYTDRLDYSQSGYLAPDLKLRFNNIISIRDVTEPTPNGEQTRSIPMNVDHVFTGVPMDSPMAYNTGPRYEISPDRILHHIGVTQDPALMGIGEQNLNVTVNNAAPQVNGINLVSRRYEARPNYLSDSITKFRSALADVSVNDTEGFYDGFIAGDTPLEANTSQVAYQKASADLRSNSVSQHSLYRQLIGMNPEFQQRGYMTYQELCDIFPELDYQLYVTFLGKPQRQVAYQPGMGEHWHGSNYETIAATIVQQALPSILSTCMTRKISFWATNDIIGGQHNIVYYEPPEGFVAGLDFASQFKDYFESRVINEVLADISRHGNLIYHLGVEIDLLSEARIRVSIDNQEIIYFVTPMFCDATFAPLMSSRYEDVNTIGRDIEQMLGDITGQTQHSPMPSGGEPGSILQQTTL